LKGLLKSKRFGVDDNNTVFLGRALTTKDNFQMFDGGYPIVTRLESLAEFSGHIQGELYSVSTSVFKALDAYEGYPSLYTRTPIGVRLESSGAESIAHIYHMDESPDRPIMTPKSGIHYWPYRLEIKQEPL
jgi:gamma-glutamylcyclotransferase (GGCT)/AIG2-like uncharacterized protein YtfP